jgi:hypothetical protein
VVLHYSAYQTYETQLAKGDSTEAARAVAKAFAVQDSTTPITMSSIALENYKSAICASARAMTEHYGVVPDIGNSNALPLPEIRVRSTSAAEVSALRNGEAEELRNENCIRIIEHYDAYLAYQQRLSFWANQSPPIPPPSMLQEDEMQAAITAVSTARKDMPLEYRKNVCGYAALLTKQYGTVPTIVSPMNNLNAHGADMNWIP